MFFSVQSLRHKNYHNNTLVSYKWVVKHNSTWTNNPSVSWSKHISLKQQRFHEKWVKEKDQSTKELEIDIKTSFCTKDFLTKVKFLYYICVQKSTSKLLSLSDVKHTSGCITKKSSSGYTHWEVPIFLVMLAVKLTHRIMFIGRTGFCSWAQILLT